MNTSNNNIKDYILAKLKKEVKDFVEYKLSAYKVANPSHIKSRYYKRSAIPAHFSLLLNL